MSKTDFEKPMSKSWHWHPSLPLRLSPIMDMPPRPLALLRWLGSYWLAVSAVTLQFVLAWLVYGYFQPEVETMRTLSLGWIFGIWLRNVILLVLVAGGLHYWFYILRGQGKALKYDRRDLSKNNGKFWFRDQVKDNIFWSIASGVTIWTGFEVLYFWLASMGYLPGLAFRQSPILFALLFVLIPIWSSFHFYLIHRLLHIEFLYRLAHGLHHRNINIGPWSGISMHPIEHLLYFSSVMIHLVVPSHPVHVLFHFYVEGLNPAFSHSGYDGVLWGDKKRIEAGDFFHQLHHRHISCNYGTVEMPWDRLFGTFHDGTGIEGQGGRT